MYSLRMYTTICNETYVVTLITVKNANKEIQGNQQTVHITETDSNQ